MDRTVSETWKWGDSKYVPDALAVLNADAALVKLELVYRENLSGSLRTNLKLSGSGKQVIAELERLRSLMAEIIHDLESTELVQVK